MDSVRFVIEKKPKIVSDNTIPVESLVEFFQNLGENGPNLSKKMAKNVLKNLGRPLDFTPNIATAVVSRNPENVMSKLPELITFCNTGKGFYLGKFV